MKIENPIKSLLVVILSLVALNLLFYTLGVIGTFFSSLWYSFCRLFY